MLTKRPIKYEWLAIIAIAVVFGSTACTSRRSTPHAAENAPSGSEININTASEEELKNIPYVGDKLAADIVEHRQRYGPFRRREHLMLIPGISDTRFRKMRDFVRTK